MRLIFQAEKPFRVESTTVILLQQYLFKRAIVISLPADETQGKLSF